MLWNIKKRLAIWLLLGYGMALHSWAATVTSLADDGSAGTLRNVLSTATNLETIDFGSLTGTITLNSPLPLPAGITLTIKGPEATSTAPAIVISGNQTFQLLTIPSNSHLTLQHIVLEKGARALIASGSSHLTLENTIFRDHQSTGSGGAILFNSSGDLTIKHSTFSKNTSGAGGAIYFDTGTTSTNLLIKDSYFSENIASTWGGAISLSTTSSAAILTIQGSAFSKNIAGYNNSKGNGGAIVLNGSINNVDAATLLINQSSFIGNEVARNPALTPDSHLASGGALDLVRGKAKITNSTFSHNKVANVFTSELVSSGSLQGGRGSAIMISSTQVEMDSVSIVANQGGGASLYDFLTPGAALFIGGRNSDAQKSALNMKNTLFAANSLINGTTAAYDIVTYAADNAPVISDSLPLTQRSKSKSLSEMGLEALGTDGDIEVGASGAKQKLQTHAIQDSSPATGTGSTLLTVDQIGIARTDPRDIGARNNAAANQVTLVNQFDPTTVGGTLPTVTLSGSGCYASALIANQTGLPVATCTVVVSGAAAPAGYQLDGTTIQVNGVTSTSVTIGFTGSNTITVTTKLKSTQATITLTNRFDPTGSIGGTLPVIQLEGTNCPAAALSIGTTSFNPATCKVKVNRSAVSAPTGKYLSGVNSLKLDGTTITENLAHAFTAGKTYQLEVLTGLQNNAPTTASITLTNRFNPDETGGTLPVVKLVGTNCPTSALALGTTTFSPATCSVVVDRTLVVPPTNKYLSGNNSLKLDGSDLSATNISFMAGTSYTLEVLTGIQNEATSHLTITNQFQPAHSNGILPLIQLTGTHCPSGSIQDGQIILTQGVTCTITIDTSYLAPPDGYQVDGTPVLKIDGVETTLPASITMGTMDRKIDLITNIKKSTNSDTVNVFFHFHLGGYAPGVLAMENTGWLVTLDCGEGYVTSYYMRNDWQYNLRSLLNVPRGNICHLKAANILANSADYYYLHDYHKEFKAGNTDLSGFPLGNPIHINIYATKWQGVPLLNEVGMLTLFSALGAVAYGYRKRKSKK